MPPAPSTRPCSAVPARDAAPPCCPTGPLSRAPPAAAPDRPGPCPASRSPTKSRSYSVTLGALRDARRAWRTEQARAQAGMPEPDPTSTLVVDHWAYHGSGYSPGAGLLTATVWHRNSHDSSSRKGLLMTAPAASLPTR
ncbi:replication initiator [Streptomyces sp. NPDC055796]